MTKGAKVLIGLGVAGSAAVTAYLIFSQSSSSQSILSQAASKAAAAVNTSQTKSPYEGKFLNVKGSTDYWIVKDGMKHRLPSGRAEDYIGAGVFSYQGPWVSRQLVDSIPAGAPWTRIPSPSDLAGLRGLAGTSSKLLN